MSDKLRIAVQKSGRLSEGSDALLRECGIQFQQGKGKLKAVAHNFPIEILFLRDDDIPAYVQDGVADVGILGENVVVEKQQSVQILERLGFSKCRLSIAVPRGATYHGIADLSGKKIATSYPHLLGSYLEAQGITAKLHFINGSVEIAPSIGLADAVCDIVSSGSTLLSNGLKEVQTIFKSEAVLIAGNGLSAERQAILDQLRFRIQSVRRAEGRKYILLNAPEDQLDTILSILPGLKSPTVMPLATKGWYSVHSVIEEDVFWEKIAALRTAGAEGILVVPIGKMII
ncbi:MAG: ATP phosphoribosyltransferase [Bernardetiaceae bacterium]